MRKPSVLFFIMLLPLAVLIACMNQKPANPRHKIVLRDDGRYKEAIFQEVALEENIVFAEVKDYEGKTQELKLDVYTPSGDVEANRPAIIWIHGGGFERKPGCDKKQNYVVALSRAFAQRGYVSFAIDYRVRAYPISDWPETIKDAVDDAKEAFRWITARSERFGVNGNYVFVAGGSAGGLVAASLCYPNYDSKSIIGLIDLWGSVSYQLPVDKNDPPAVMIHGTGDEMVPYSVSEKLSWELSKKGIVNVLHPIEGAGHTPIDHMDEIVDTIRDFSYKIISER